MRAGSWGCQHSPRKAAAPRAHRLPAGERSGGPAAPPEGQSQHLAHEGSQFQHGLWCMGGCRAGDVIQGRGEGMQEHGLSVGSGHWVAISNGMCWFLLFWVLLLWALWAGLGKPRLAACHRILEVDFGQTRTWGQGWCGHWSRFLQPVGEMDPPSELRVIPGCSQPWPGTDFSLLLTENRKMTKRSMLTPVSTPQRGASSRLSP